MVMHASRITLKALEDELRSTEEPPSVLLTPMARNESLSTRGSNTCIGFAHERE